MNDVKRGAMRKVCISAAEILLGFLGIFRETASILSIDAAGNEVYIKKTYTYSIYENAVDGGFGLLVPLFLAAALASAVLGVLLRRHPDHWKKEKAVRICFVVSQVLFVLLFVAAACVSREY